MNTFLSEANKLKNIQFYLEKSEHLLNHISKSGCDLNLLDYALDLEQKRKNEIEQITNELKNIWYLLQKKKKHLVEENVNKLDLHLFKQDMIELQDKIHSLRTRLSSNNEIQKEQEKNIMEMTEIFREKLEEWDKPIKLIRKHNYTTSKCRPLHDSNLKEVIAFMEFVNRSNGHENGWSIEDHQIFLKLRHKCKNIDDLAINFNKMFPDVTPDDVKQHENWFERYLFLKDEKNKALERWRKQQKNHVQDSQDVDDENVQNPTINKIHKQSKTDDIHEQIILWKAEKNAQRQQKEANEQLQSDNKKKREEYQKRVHLHVKQAVAKWKEAKIVKEQNEKTQKEIQDYYQKKIRSATANKMIKQFQTQDDMFIAKMRSIKLKEDNENKRRSKSSYLVDRDPKRVLKPTKQWLFRTTKNDLVDKTSSYIPNIRVIPKLKIPEWRRNKKL